MSLWLEPLSHLYRAITEIKNDLYAKKKLKMHRLPVPVISIGNLTVGGTGKTPIVNACIRHFLDQGMQVAVVSRAYKASAQKPVKVDTQQKNASSIYGDEPLWLAQQNPRASVFVGQKKWEIAAFAVSQQKVDVVIIDDGFQHRRLHRDLDIVILDATEKWENYRPLPLGKGRESFANINRADAVVISKCNWADPLQLAELRQHLPADKPVIEMGFQAKKLKNFVTGEVKDAQDFASKKALLFCSIARPEIFSLTASPLFAQTVLLPFPDHHPYEAEDIGSILAKKNKHQMDIICCTEKDAVKLADLWPRQQDLWVTQLEIDVLTNQEKLDEIFARVCS